VVALAACAIPKRHTAQTLLFVVPADTTARILRGDKVEIMPAELQLHVGDVIRIRNEDAHPQKVGPYYVKPHSQVDVRYGAPGTFVGTCKFTRTGRYEIVVRS